MRTIDPDGAYTVTDMLLRNVELWTHVAAWHNTKDGKHGRNKPELVKLPSQMQHTRSIEDAIADRKYVDSVLGAAAKRSDESDTSPLKEVD